MTQKGLLMRQLRMRLASILLIGLLAACTGGRTAAPSPAANVESQAPVTSVEVLQALGSALGSDGELRALVKGSLPDACTRLGEAVVSSGGALIVVILPAYRTAGSTCPGGAVAFERTVSLGSHLAAGSYTISVNGVNQPFVLSGGDQSAAQANLPAPTATPAPVESAAATTLPTAVAAAEVTSTATALTPTQAAQASVQPTVNAQPAAAGQPQIVNTAGNNAPCVNKAAFFADVSVPDGSIFDPGQKFTKTWRIRNAGTCTWEGYTLVFKDGSLLGAGNPQTITGSVEPNGTVDISVNMLAPDTPGSYYSNWLFSTGNGAEFGLGAAGSGLLWTKVGVRTIVPLVNPLETCASQTDSSIEAVILGLINAARQQQGLAALTLDSQLSTAARGHSKDMACNDFVDHYGSDGSNWYTRIQAAGVKYKSANENIYAGNPAFGGDANGAFTWWMNSQIHRDNILNALSTRIGIGYVFFSGSTYKAYYTLNFVQ